MSQADERGMIGSTLVGRESTRASLNGACGCCFPCERAQRLRCGRPRLRRQQLCGVGIGVPMKSCTSSCAFAIVTKCLQRGMIGRQGRQEGTAFLCVFVRVSWLVDCKKHMTDDRWVNRVGSASSCRDMSSKCADIVVFKVLRRRDKLMRGLCSGNNPSVRRSRSQR